MSFPKYPAYKASGVEWIGEIPKAWSVTRVKDISYCNPESWPENTHPSTEIHYIEISDVNEVKGVTNYTTLTFGQAPSRARKIIRCGDIIISTVRTYLRAISQITYKIENLTASTGFAVFRAKDIFATYLAYVCHSNFFLATVISQSVGVSYPAINSSEIEKIFIPLPSFLEQKAIATFLDRECTKIDALIAEQEYLIILLQEKRQAVISHAVTKGLDPNIPMKDTGIKWIGSTPTDWTVLPIKRVCQVSRGASPRPIDDPKYFDDNGEFSWVRISDVTKSNGYLNETEQRLSKIGSNLSVKIFPDEIFVSIAGSVGKPCISKIKACIHDGFVYFKNASFRKKFLFYIFEAGSCYKGLGKMGTQLNLNTDTIGSIYISLPPDKIQKEIISYLDDYIDKYTKILLTQHKTITLLKERRSALISAAVTGKIDVRTVVKPKDIAA